MLSTSSLVQENAPPRELDTPGSLVHVAAVINASQKRTARTKASTGPNRASAWRGVSALFDEYVGDPPTPAMPNPEAPSEDPDPSPTRLPVVGAALRLDRGGVRIPAPSVGNFDPTSPDGVEGPFPLLPFLLLPPLLLVVVVEVVALRLVGRGMGMGAPARNSSAFWNRNFTSETTVWRRLVWLTMKVSTRTSCILTATSNASLAKGPTFGFPMRTVRAVKMSIWG